MAEPTLSTKPHCWHNAGVAPLSNPPQFHEVCCHCGNKRPKPVVFGTPLRHGPFAPNVELPQRERNG